MAEGPTLRPHEYLRLLRGAVEDIQREVINGSFGEPEVAARRLITLSEAYIASLQDASKPEQ